MCAREENNDDAIRMSPGRRGTLAAAIQMVGEPRLSETITMKAIEKQRNRRYSTASEFAADIQRFLNGEPVLARPPSILYKTQKLLARYRHRVALIGGVAVLVVLSTILASWYFRWSADLESNQTARRVREVAEQKRAEYVAARRLLQDAVENSRSSEFRPRMPVWMRAPELQAIQSAEQETQQRYADAQLHYPGRSTGRRYVRPFPCQYERSFGPDRSCD